MPNVFSLEAFDAETSASTQTGSEVPQSYEDGFAAGMAAAKQEQIVLSAELVQCIADLEFSYSEARLEVLGALAPLLVNVTETLLPHCVSSGFTHEIGLIIHETVASGVPEDISVTVHPSQRASIEAALREQGSGAEIREDSGLSAHAAWIKRGTHESYFDLDNLLSRITEILTAIDPSQPRMTNHG